MKPGRKHIILLLFCLMALTCFTDARKFSARHLRTGGFAEWYLNHNLDSAGFFSADTLCFINPYPGYFQIETLPCVDPAEAYKMNPVIWFGTYGKDVFEINFDYSENTNADGILYGGWSKSLWGRYIADKKEKTLRFDFYDPSDSGSDDIANWKKYDSKKYHVLFFSKDSLTIVRNNR